MVIRYVCTIYEKKQEIHINLWLGYIMARDDLKDIGERLDLTLKCS